MPYHDPPEDVPRPSRPPLIARGPIAWEDESLGLLGRFLGTLAATFKPLRTLRAVAHGPIKPAVVFFLFSSLPWMALWAIVPLTHTLLFGPSFGIKLAKGAVAAQVQGDVLRAVALGLVLSGIGFVSWALPFASLTRAFCASPPHADEARRAAFRTALYRAWIIPFGFSVWWFIAWATPAEPSEVLLAQGYFACHFVPRLLMLLHCQAMARYVGASTMGALGVAIVPVALDWAVGQVLWQVAREFLPPGLKP